MPAWNGTAEVMGEAEVCGGLLSLLVLGDLKMAATLRPLNSLSTLHRVYPGECTTMEVDNSKGLMLVLRVGSSWID